MSSTALPAAADWGEWLDRLGALATRALKQPDRVLAVLAELAPMASGRSGHAERSSDRPRRSLLEAAVPPPSQRYGKVFVGPIEAARGLSFDAVFVPGLAEKMFPRKIVEEPILLDALREQIGGGLATNQSRLEARASRPGACGRRGRAPDLLLLSPSRPRPGPTTRAVLLCSGGRAGRRGPASRLCRACATGRNGNHCPARLAGTA